MYAYSIYNAPAAWHRRMGVLKYFNLLGYLFSICNYMPHKITAAGAIGREGKAVGRGFEVVLKAQTGGRENHQMDHCTNTSKRQSCINNTRQSIVHSDIRVVYQSYT